MSVTLFSTKYANNIRTVSGSNVSVYKDDVVLMCDTSLAAVNINLDEIPAGYWNTLAKLYVFDSANNAGTYNITITAPAGFKINNAQTLTINTSGGGVVIRIGSDLNYIATANYALPSAPQIVSILNAALLTLMAANGVTPGIFYNVTDATNTNGGVIVQGITTGSVSVEGTGMFLNPIYTVTGNYVGAWHSGLTGLVANVSQCVWNGYYYTNLTGSVGTAPSGDAVNWLIVSKSVANGYVLECDFIKYSASSNIVTYRADKRKNEVDYYFDGGSIYSTVNFQWGNDLVYGNKVLSGSYFDCLNQRSTISNNTVSSGSNVAANTQSGIINANVITNSSTVTLTSNTGNINRNVIETNGVFSFTNNSANLNDNIVKKGTLQASSNNAAITGCEVGGGMDVNLLTNTTAFTNLRCVSGFSNWTQTLDCAEVVAANLLTIPSTSAYVGAFLLSNSNGLTIIKIANLPTNHDCIFKINSGTTTFNITSVSSAVANHIVPNYTITAPSFVLTARSNGTDNCVLRKNGTFNCIAGMLNIYQ